VKMYLHFTPGDSVLFGPWIPNIDRAPLRGYLTGLGTLDGYSRLGCRESFGHSMMTVAITAYVEPCVITVWRVVSGRGPLGVDTLLANGTT